MKTKEVSYSRLESYKDRMGNRKVGITVVVENGEGEDVALQIARDWVGQKLADEEKNLNDYYKEQDSQCEINRLEQTKKDLSDQINKMVDFLEKHGVNIKEDIPF